MQEIKFGPHGDLSWIIIDTDQTELTEDTVKGDIIDNEIVAYALDRNERAMIDYDREDGTLLVIFNALNLQKDDNHYETVPISLLTHRHQLITLVNAQNRYIISSMERQLARQPQMDIPTFLFTALTLITKQYFPVMDELDREKDRVNSRLRQQTSKHNLLALSDLETGLVYLLAAANQNVLLLDQLKIHPVNRNLSEQALEQLDDALIEARQLASMSQLYSQILQQLTSTYNNVLNNNLNDNLTTLNIISIILAVWAVITGFFGMNVPLPFMKDPYAWLYILGSCIVIWLLIATILRMMIKKK